jgi:hypothetical protein
MEDRQKEQTMKRYFKFQKIHAFALASLLAICVLLKVVLTHASFGFMGLGGSEPSSSTTVSTGRHTLKRGQGRESHQVGKQKNGSPSSSAIWDPVLSRQSKEISSFYALKKDDPKRFKILQSVAGNPLADLNEIVSMAESLPDGTRSTALAMISERCAKESPEIFFKILGSLPPGELRIRALQAGAFKLKSRDLRELVKVVSEDGDSDEIAATASEIKLREESNDITVPELLTMALDASTRDELSSSLIELGGSMSVDKQSDLPEQSALEKLNQEKRMAFYQGRLKKLIELDDERFAMNLRVSNLDPGKRSELIREWANQVTITNSFEEAIRKGNEFQDQEHRTYYETTAKAFIGRDSMEASKVIANMPSGDQKNIFVECLVNYLKANGDLVSAARWQKLLPPK